MVRFHWMAVPCLDGSTLSTVCVAVHIVKACACPAELVALGGPDSVMAASLYAAAPIRDTVQVSEWLSQ